MSESASIPQSRRTVLVTAVALAASPAFAQTPRPPVRVTLSTSEGPIVIELNLDKAPITAGNFLRYVDMKRMDGATFYRASKPPGGGDDFGLVQGGLQNDPAKLLKPIAHESTLVTGLSHVDGAISMGRLAPGTATADFFILVGDQTYLDADPKAPGDNQGFAAFGKVVEGMDVVRKILNLPRSPTAGEGVMKGEMLQKPLVITTARRAD